MAKKVVKKPAPVATTRKADTVRTLSLLSDLSPDYGGELRVASFDLKDLHNMERIVKSNLTPDLTRGDIEGQVLHVVHWYARWESNIASRDDDPRPGVRLTLWTTEDKTFTCTGKTALDCWSIIITAAGTGPFDPPIPVTVQTYALAGNRETYAIMPHLTNGSFGTES